MYGRTNARGGISPFAFIFATYPAGSICTCTDGSRTLKLKDTSGYGVFYPPYIGKWTVTCTDPTGANKSVSKAVEITYEGQSESVELTYELWLYKDGDHFAENTGGWDTRTNGGTASVSAAYLGLSVTSATNVNRFASVGTKNLIDVTNYTTLRANEGWIKSKSSSGAGAVIALSKTRPSSYEGQSNAASTSNNTLDISKLTGEYYICVNAWTGGVTGYYITCQVTEVMLE